MARYSSQGQVKPLRVLRFPRHLIHSTYAERFDPQVPFSQDGGEQYCISDGLRDLGDQVATLEGKALLETVDTARLRQASIARSPNIAQREVFFTATKRHQTVKPAVNKPRWASSEQRMISACITTRAVGTVALRFPVAQGTGTDPSGIQASTIVGFAPGDSSRYDRNLLRLRFQPIVRTVASEFDSWLMRAKACPGTELFDSAKLPVASKGGSERLLPMDTAERLFSDLRRRAELN